MHARRHGHRLLAVLLGLLTGIVAIEAVVRLYSGLPLLELGGHESDRYVVIDPVVGRIPKADLKVHHPRGFDINTGDHGTRRNGDQPPPLERPLTLAVGDSFAFGDDVNDDQSWPALLEQLTGRRVVNAGVPGFGLDQAVLRAEQLAPVYRPDFVVVAFIPHDILRCEMSYWSGHGKPYFELDGAGLHPQPAPIAPPPAFSGLRRVLSASAALDLLFPRFLHWEGPESVVVHHQGKEVACALMQRLAQFGKARQARVIVLAQPQAPETPAEYLDLKDYVLSCARANELATLDLFPAVAAMPADERAGLFHGHMTVAGNRLVASELAALLRAEAVPHRSAP